MNNYIREPLRRRSKTICFLLAIVLVGLWIGAIGQENKYDKLVAEELASKRIAVIGTKPLEMIKIEGEIRKGDYRNVLELIRTTGRSVHTVSLMSPGGDALEAMKIGRLIRRLRYHTSAPAFELDGQRTCLPAPTYAENCACDSSCFLIYIAGVHRHAHMLGIHRIYVEHTALSAVSGTDAALLASAIRSKVASYMNEMGAPNSYTEKLFSVPSNAIRYMSNEDMDRYFLGDIEQFSEWIQAKCSKEVEYDRKMTAIYEKDRAGKASKEEVLILQESPQFYLKLAACKTRARNELIDEVWVTELRRAIKDEYPGTKFKYGDDD